MKNLTDQGDEVYLQKKIQKIRRKERNDKIGIIIGVVLIMVGWPLYNFKIHHHVLGGVSIEHPYLWAGFLLLVLGIFATVFNIVDLAYFRLQKKKYMEQLRQLQR